MTLFYSVCADLKSAPAICEVAGVHLVPSQGLNLAESHPLEVPGQFGGNKKQAERLSADSTRAARARKAVCSTMLSEDGSTA